MTVETPPQATTQPHSHPLIDVQVIDAPVEYGRLQPFPHASGGECVFLGRTRAENHPIHGELQRLVYEAYQPMAERVLRQLADEAICEFECQAVRIHHAIGPVRIGEASVLIQVASGHRTQAFEACRHLIDALKERVPVWKKEEWAEGETWSDGQPVAPAGPFLDDAL